MSEPFGRLRRFLRELKRRNVYRVAATYVAVSFVGLQAVNLLIPATTLPGWADQLFLGLVVLGFPVSVVVAWAFEMSPQGMRRTETPEGQEPVGAGFQWMGLALMVLVAGGVWYATGGGEEQSATEPTATTDTAARTASTPRDTAGPSRVAVLPFDNIGRDTGDAGFARGMYEEVLNQLSKVSGLAVLSRKTGMELAESDMTAAEIGREHKVQAILEGSVDRVGDRLRIRTQLIRAPDDEQLWSNSYDRTLSVQQVFDIQADIAEKIAGSLETQLTEGERQRIESAPTDDLVAYEAYLRGRSSWFETWATQAPDDVQRSIEALREAVRRDSTFAEAHAWLALAYANRSVTGEENRWVDSASAAVERAKAIDPNVAAAHLAEAEVHRYRFREPRAVGSVAVRIAFLRRALELQPSHVLAKSTLGDALGAHGQHVEAIRVAREAVQLAPRQPLILQELADQLRAVGLYDASQAWDRRVLEIEPGHFEAIRGLAFTQVRRGRPEPALETSERYLEGTEEPSPFALEFVAQVSLAAGQPDRAKGYLDRIKEERRRRFQEGREAKPDPSPTGLSYRLLGLTEFRLGDRQQGLTILQKVADSLRAEVSEQEASPDTVERLAQSEFDLAHVLAALGQSEEALELLRAADLGGSGHGLLTYGMGLESPFFGDLRSDPGFQEIVSEVEARREKIREQVHQLDIDLYPPGTEPNSVADSAPTDG